MALDGGVTSTAAETGGAGFALARTCGLSLDTGATANLGLAASGGVGLTGGAAVTDLPGFAGMATGVAVALGEALGCTAGVVPAGAAAVVSPAFLARPLSSATVDELWSVTGSVRIVATWGFAAADVADGFAGIGVHAVKICSAPHAAAQVQ